jgi:hypothetical protein
VAQRLAVVAELAVVLGQQVVRARRVGVAGGQRLQVGQAALELVARLEPIDQPRAAS